jgi:GNAT superfamily N-acetyltransferase
MPKTVKIRITAETDILPIAALTADCYRAMAGSESYSQDELSGLLTQCASPESIRRQYRDCMAFVAEQDGLVLGVVAICKNEIVQLFVSPEMQCRGIGAQLLTTAEAAVLSTNYAEINVYTATAPGFYQKMGYKITGHRICSNGPLKGRTLTVFAKTLKPRI